MPEFSQFGFRHTKAKVGDVNLHYVIGGSGDPLVLLHGFPETSHQWRKVMPALAERFTVLATGHVQLLAVNRAGTNRVD